MVISFDGQDLSSFSFDRFLILSFIIISCHLYPILISKHLSLSDLDHTHKAPASKVPWNLVGLGVGVCAAFLLVVICCDIKVQVVPRMLHCRLDWLLASLFAWSGGRRPRRRRISQLRPCQASDGRPCRILWKYLCNEVCSS